MAMTEGEWAGIIIGIIIAKIALIILCICVRRSYYPRRRVIVLGVNASETGRARPTSDRAGIVNNEVLPAQEMPPGYWQNYPHPSQMPRGQNYPHPSQMPRGGQNYYPNPSQTQRPQGKPYPPPGGQGYIPPTTPPPYNPQSRGHGAPV